MYWLLFLCIYLFLPKLHLCQDGAILDNDQQLYATECFDLDERCIPDLINCTLSGCVCRNSTMGYFYNETSKSCVFNLKLLLLTLVEKYNSEEKIKNESIRVFRGILISAILFAACAIIGLVSACVYCCRISYKDEKLKRHIKKNFPGTKPIVKTPKPALAPISENCNVVVGETGLFVV